MKASELRELTREELLGRLNELKEELFQLRFEKAMAAGSMSNPHRFKEIRRDIARILTILNERKRSEAS